jgi:hypothetical protein
MTMRVVGGDEKWSLRSEAVKYGHESQGTRNRERLCWRPSSRQRGRLTKTRPSQSKSNKYLVMSPRWDSTPRLTDWQTVSRNVTLTLTLTCGLVPLGSCGGKVPANEDRSRWTLHCWKPLPGSAVKTVTEDTSLYVTVICRESSRIL